jgi:hypothetical protein
MSKKIKRYKVGLDSETMAISLVTEPAIEIDFIHMSKDEEEKQQVFLEKDEKYLVYGPALIPDKDIYRNNGEQEYYLSFSKESIEKMENDYMKDFRQYNVSTQHKDKVDEVCVVESWLVADSYKDKANALGFNVPEGTWMVAMKVNNVDTWNRIKDGELKGFSVESLVSLEEFNKVQNDSEMDVNDETFWTKLKNVLSEAFGKKDENLSSEEELKEELNEQKTDIVEEELEEAEKPVETPSEEPKVEQPTTVQEEPKQEPVEPANEPAEKPVEEQPKNDGHLEELINNLKAEIEALKDVNKGLTSKVKELGKTPSTKPVNTNAPVTGVKGDAYAQWRETMRELVK